jgi:hypothetical protein
MFLAVFIGACLGRKVAHQPGGCSLRTIAEAGSGSGTEAESIAGKLPLERGVMVNSIAAHLAGAGGVIIGC